MHVTESTEFFYENGLVGFLFKALFCLIYCLNVIVHVIVKYILVSLLFSRSSCWHVKKAWKHESMLRKHGPFLVNLYFENTRKNT